MRAHRWVVAALTAPTIHVTFDEAEAEASFWTYRREPGRVFRLTPLGVLHTLTGLTLETRDPR